MKSVLINRVNPVFRLLFVFLFVGLQAIAPFIGELDNVQAAPARGPQPAPLMVTVPAEMNKSFTPIAIVSGATSKLRVTVYNLNANELTDATWADDMPEGITFADPLTIVNTCGGSVTDLTGNPLAVGGNDFKLTGGTVPAQDSNGIPGSCYVEVDVTSYTPGNLINTIPAGNLSSKTIDPGNPGTPVEISNTTPASATLNVIGVESPSLSKAFAPTTLWVGETSTLTVTIHNNDLDSPLTNLTLTDILPTNGNGDIFVTSPLNYSLTGCGTGATLTNAADDPLEEDDTTIVLKDATVEPDSNCVIEVDVTTMKQGSYTNTIPAGPAETNPGAIDTQEGVTNESPAEADVNFRSFTLTKTFGTSPIAVGETSVVTITIVNHAPIDYTGAALEDTLPAGLEFVPGTASTNCTTGTDGATVSLLPAVSTPKVTASLTNGTIPANSTCTITATARALMSAEPGTKTNTIDPGDLTTTEGAINHGSSSANLVVESLSVAKDFAETEIPLGGTSLLTITISNPSPTPFTNTSLDDVLPAGLEYVAGTGSTTCVSGSVSLTSTTMSLTGATIPSGSLASPGTCIVTSTVRATPSEPPTDHTNTIPADEITTAEGGTNAFPASDDITVTGLVISKGFSPTVFAAGQTTTLTITITNPATIEFTGANLSDTLPTTPNDELFFTGTPTTTCVNADNDQTVLLSGSPERTVTLTNGTIPANGSCTITATVTTDPDAPQASDYENIIPKDALVTDEGASNSEPASATVDVATISVNKLFNGTTVVSTLAYPNATLLEITVTNPANGQALTGLTVTDSLPAGLEVAPYIGNGGTNPAPKITNCGAGELENEAGGTLEPGDTVIKLVDGTLGIAPATCTISVYVRPQITASSGTYTNVLDASSVITDQGPQNSNTISRDIRVNAVSVTKAFQYAGFEAGGTNLLTITLHNPTGEDYTNAAVSDTLPTSPNSNLRFTGTPSTTCVGGAVSFSGAPTRTVSLIGGTIPANGTCTITATVTTDSTVSGASYTNRIPTGALTTEVGSPAETGPSNTTAATAPVYVYEEEEGVTGTKSFSPTTINIFGTSRLTITFTAPPDTNLTNFSFVDTLPAELVLASPLYATTSGCGAGAALTDGSNGVLAAGDTSVKLSGASFDADATCTVTVDVTTNNGTGTGKVYTNTIEPGDVSNDEVRKPASDVSANLTVNTPSTLLMRKAFYPTVVSPEGLSRLTITLENEGASELVDIILTDNLPGVTGGGLVIAPVPNITSTCTDPSNITAVPGSSTLSMTNGSLPAQVNGVNGLCTINVNVQGKSSDGTNPITVTNTIPVTGVTARIFDIPATMNAQDPAEANVTIRDLDLEVVKGFDPQLVYGGADSEMSIILRNPNLSAELTEITFTDSMPVVSGEGMILSDPTLFDASDCGPDATLTKIDNSTFEFAGGYLAAGDECTLTLRATMNVNGNRTNTIPIHGVSSFNGAKNESATSATLTNLAGASVSKSFAPNPVAAGLGSYSILTIQIRTTATVRITGLGLTDTLPAGLQVADWSAGGVAAGDPPTNNCGLGGTEASLTANPADTTIILSGGELPIGFGDCELIIPVTGRDPGDYENTIPQGGLTNNEGIVNIQSTTDTLVLTPYSLGNRVWFDTNNNGLVDAGEVGVENVRVELYREIEGSPNSFEFLKFETTDADGYYRFDDLGGGDYFIMIPDDNFRDVGATDTVASDPLAGYVSSGTSIDASGTMTDAIQTDPDNDVDNDDNGITNTTAGGALNFISSQVVTLGPDSVEPENEGDPTTNPETGEAIDAQSNRTVDFGFYRQELGNLVFLDEVIDGVYDAGDDSPIAGATVRLFSSDGTEIITGADGIWGTDDDGWGPDGASGGGDDGDGGMLTDASGNYLFSGLPEGDYIVKVYLPGYRSTIDTDPSNTPADVADPDTNIDNNDNGSGQDEGLVSSFPVTLTPNDAGDASNNIITNSTATTYNPTLDFGYVLPRSIGNRLWFDDGGTTGTANNGILDGNEAPVVGARVSLYEDANTDGVPDGAALRWDITDAGGYYLFDGLFPGSYLVGVDYTNFQTGQALAEYTSSTGAASNDTDSNDNGIDRSLPGDATASPYGILSNTIDLTAVTDSAPTGETDLSSDNISGDFSNNPTDWDGADSLGRYGEADENSDVTIDFGFYKPMSIGNRVFYDNGAGSNLDNGIMDGDENPVAGVRVELYQDTDGTSGLDPDTDTLLYFDTTDAGGYYLFDQLLAGEYYVHIPSSNFTGSGVLRGWYNSNATFSDDVDSNDNGVTNVHPNINGVTSGLLTLSEDAEPTLETELSGDTTPAGDDYDPTAWDGPESRGRWNESDDNSNLTVDFGFIPPLSLGNRVWLDEGGISASPYVDLTQFNDGVMNGIEEGIGNVVLNLYYSSNDADFNDTVDGVDEADIYRTTTTDADGYYLFDGLPEGQFYVEVAASNFSSGNALAGLQSSADQGAFDDEITDINDNGEDDSAYLTNGIASRNFVLNYEGEPTGEDVSSDTTAYGSDGWGLYGEEDSSSNLTLDFGFMSPHSIGNRVWRDSDNSGTINPADDTSPGIGGVTVNLYAGLDANSDGIPDDLTILATTITSSTAGNDGFYLFDNLPAGNYIVGIPASNFGSTEPLYNLRSSTGAPAVATYENPVDANPDRSDHGIDPAVAGEAVYSPIIALGDNELLNESDLPNDTTTYGDELRGVNGEPDAGSDLSVDFGFFGGTDVPFSIGNHLWYDDGAGGGTINNGIRDGAELPVAGARVELYRDGDGDGIPQTDELIRFDITDSGGFYLFDNLDPGSYFVKVAAGNFTDSFDPDGSSGPLPAAPGVLRGWYSSQNTWAEESPSIVLADDNDNGVNAAKPEVDGVFSGVVVLERGFNEPSGESYLSSDTGTNFGINPTEDDGPDSRGRFGETDVTSNLTIDFGFIPPMSIGNRVWIDDGAGIADFSGYNNGEMDGAGTENLNGVSGVEVELYKDGVYFYTTTTDADGYYLFDRLQPGNYTVKITAANFASGGPLEFYQSSTDTNQASVPADDDEDLDDTGVDDAAYLTNGISSPVIEMEYDTESIAETDLSTDTTTYGVDNVGPYPGHTDINSNLTVDFGFFRPRSLGNRVWFDTNNNGRVTTGEQPVPDGVRVSLYEDANTDGIPDGPALRYDTTENGFYLFDNLPPRNYIVGIDAANFQTGGNLIGYFSSTATYNNATNNNDRRDNGINSNNPAGSTYGILSSTINLTGETGYPTGETDLSGDNSAGTLANNPTNWDGPGSIGRYGEADESSDLTIDFGFYKVEIGNLVYFDTNADGTYAVADGDTVLDDVLVQLYATDGAGNITTEIITGADGIWHTDDDGWGPNGVNDGGGDDGTGGILTNASGEYLFSGLPAGTYIVKVTTPTSPQQLVSTIDSFDQDDNDDPDDGTDNNDNGVGIGSATKDAVYSKELTMSGGESILPAVSFDHTDGTTTDTSVDFGFTDAYALGNRVWYDTNNNGQIDGSETGVNDVTVQLYAADASGKPVGTVLDTTTTGSGTAGNGYYVFDYLTAGDYVVVIPASEFDSTDASASLIGYWSSATTMGANGSMTETPAIDPDDDADSDDNGTLETTVSDPFAGAVISQAVTLGLSGNTEPTDDDDLKNPPADDSTRSDGYSNLSVDFGFYRTEIGNLVYNDLNKNGIFDGSDTLIDGMTVRLYNSDNTVEIQVGPDGIFGTADDATGGVTTGSNGWSSGVYLFSGLPEGDYVVRAEGLTNYTSTIDTSPSNTPADVTDPDTNVDNNDNGIGTDAGTVNSGQLTMDAGETAANITVNNDSGTTTDSTVDFGFINAYALGNRVWFDTNNDGLLNGTEVGASGVTVQLYNADTMTKIATGPDGIPGNADDAGADPVTNASGYYLFDYLDAGNYLVVIPAAEFGMGGTLDGYYSSLTLGNDNGSLTETAATDPDDDADSDDDGTLDISGGVLDGAVTSLPITLGTGASEPTNDDDLDSGNDGAQPDAQANMTVDFGFYKTEIGNLVYLDENANGTYDAGTDTPLDDATYGVTVQLYAGDGVTLLDTTTTDSNGEYLFTGLPDGDYYITVLTPDGFVSTIDTADSSDTTDPDDATDNNDNGIGIGMTTSVSVTSGELTTNAGEEIAPAVTTDDASGTTTDLSVDFGFTYPYAIGNRVWYDTNNSSNVDNGEGLNGATKVGVDGVRVELYAASDLSTMLAFDTTANGGYYLFDYLTAGDYVVVIPEDNFGDVGAGDTVLADPLEGYWSSATQMLSTGVLSETRVTGGTDNDADSDDNGLLVSGDIVSVTVRLGLTGNSEQTGEADLDGGSDGDQTDGRTNMTIDFGFYRTEIGNLVYNDLNKNGIFDGSDTLIDGMTVRLYNSDNTVEIQVGPDGILGTADDATGGVTTGSNGWGSGVYLFSGLPEGDYVVRAEGLTNYTSTIDTSPSNTPADVTDPDTNVDNNDNGIGTDAGTVNSGQLTMDAGETAANITVNNDSGTTTDSTVDFGFINAYALGNRVWFDTDNSATINGTEVGVDNVDVELYSTSDLSVRIASTTTSNGGYYLFDYLDAGEYVVVIPAAEFESGATLEGYHSSETAMNLTTGAIEEATAPDADSNALDSDDNGTLNLDATNFAGAVISAPVTLGTGDSEPINETDLDGGSQGAQPDAQANMTIDFGFYKTEIGNLVWLDKVADGEYIPADDSLLDGVTVELYNGVTNAFITDTTTNASGEYLFDGLPEGEYIVKAIAPTGTVSTRDDADSADNADPDTNTDNNDNGIGTSSGTAASAVVTMEAAESAANITVTNLTGTTTDSTLDFGFSYAYALGNRVWFDTDNDSMIGGSEVGVGNVTVELYAAGDLTTVLATDTTDANGYYLFDSLLPGSYVVAIPAEEFDSASPLGGTLEGYWSSATSIAADGTISETAITGLTDDDQDSDDNGTLQANGDVLSVAIILGPAGDSEPGSELDLGPDGQGIQPDTRANMTVDFGFYKTEIGNLVFGDVDKNGNYDGSDTTFSGVTVQLYAYGTDGTDGVEIPVGADGVLGTADDGTGGTQTNASGEYRFSGLPAGDYVVKVIAPTGTVSTIDSFDAADSTDPNTNTNNNDNGIGELDGVVIANSLTMNPGADAAKPNLTITHATGTTLDNTLDFGFTTVFALGNRVWFDTNNNAVIDNGEVGVNGVTVELYADDGAGNPKGPMLDSDITAGDGTNDGYYLFDYLETGDYIVVIPAAEFGTGGTLEGYYSSSTSMLADGTLSETRLTGNADDDVDSNDNGLLSSGDVISVPIKLGPTAIEQTLESDLNAGSQGSQPDAQANMTVDFGFYTMTLGNLVWDDLDNSGTVNGTETGIDDVTVELYAQNGTTLLDTVTTSGGGNYAFTGLPAGDYIVRIPAAEFEGTEELRDYVSSTGTANAYEPAPDADTDLTDDDDNGSQTGGTTGLGGYIQTEIITLSPTLEGSYDNDTGTTFEQRVDLGVYSFAQADLAITKDDGQTFYLQGGTLTYTIVVSNTGPADVTGAVVSDSLPTQISSWDWVCDSSTGGASECDDVSDSSADFSDTVDLPINSSITYIVTATIDAAATGVLTNTAIVSPPTGVTETDTTNNTADDVDDPSFLSITKDDGLDVVAPGSEITYTIDIYNGGLVDLTDLTVTDTLPADVTYQSATPAPSDVTGNVLTWDHAALGIGGDLLAGAHAYVSVTVQVKDVPAGSSITNNITVSDTVTKTTASDDDTDAIAIDNTKVLFATSEYGSADQSVYIGEILTYQISIVIPAGVTMRGLQAFDVLDLGLAFDECYSISFGELTTNLADGFAGACPMGGDSSLADPVVTNAGQNVTFNFGDVTNASDSEQTLTLQYWVDVLDIAENVDGVDDLNNEITWVWYGGSLTDSAVPVEIIEPDLSIVKDASPQTALLGSTITFTIDIAHTAASTADAYDVVVTDILPAGLEYVDGSISRGIPFDYNTDDPATLENEDGFSYDPLTRTITLRWDYFPLVNGTERGSSTITFKTIFVGPSPVTNEASVKWTSIPLDPGIQSEYNEDSTERWYDPNDPTGVDNYGASSDVTIRVPVLPETGFAPGRFTQLPAQPADVVYTQFDSFSLEIPRIKETMPIVGVPYTDQGWDLTWLSDQAGWLEGTAYPTWEGNTALTAHVYLADGTPGPFANLNQLYWGDQIIIYADGQTYIYEVRETRQIWPHDLSALRHEDYDWITLITCRDYSEINEAYAYRTVVRAILVEVKSD